MAPMRLEIISAERVLFEGDVDVVVAPGTEGELGILPNHEPLMTMLQAGEVHYSNGSDEEYLTVSGGFMEINGGRVVILTDAAERVEEIDEARAQEAARRAQEWISAQPEEIDLEQALHSLRRAQVRVQAVNRRRRRRDLIGPGSNAPSQ